MTAIPHVGKCFPTAAQFLDYLDDIKFGAWRPRFIVLHHTGIPDRKMWDGWQGRTSDEQWMKNLAAYYGNELGWSSGPQFFFTPTNYCVLSLPDRRGIHAAAFNSVSWGVETVGNFDRDPFDGVIRDRVIEGLACLHLATGLTPDFVFKTRGLHFHRDDPTTSKTCPGTKVQRDPLIAAIKAKMLEMSDGDDQDDETVDHNEQAEHKPPGESPNAPPEGIVAVDDLNLRAEASGRSAVIRELTKDTKLAILGEAMNGSTKWLRVWLRVKSKPLVGWVADAFVKRT